MVLDKPIDVLLVEDDPNDADLAKRVLARATTSGYSVLHVSDGSEASELVNSEDRQSIPRLVLLDLKLPKFDGFTVLERLRARPEWSTVPVVVLSSSSIDEDISRSYGLGANAYVVKPIRYDQYKTAMERIAEFWLEIVARQDVRGGRG